MNLKEANGAQCFKNSLNELVNLFVNVVMLRCNSLLNFIDLANFSCFSLL